MNDRLEKVKKCIDVIRDDRIHGVQNDLKAFLYIRQNNLAHTTPDNIGGGNMVVALSLFSILSLLGKAYYSAIRPDKFRSDGRFDNEAEIFVHFMKFLQERDINLGLPNEAEVLEVIWNGFRNYLAHRLTVQQGKSVVTFTFEPGHGKTIDEIIKAAKSHQVFVGDKNNTNWEVNGDALYAHMPDIIRVTMEHISSSQGIDADLLLKIVGVDYP